MDSIVIENQVIERRPECLITLSTKVQKLMRKYARAKGRTADFSRSIWRVLNIHQHLSSILATSSVTTIKFTYARCSSMTAPNFFSLWTPRLLVDPIDATVPMRRQRLNRLSRAERENSIDS
jgi:hypothetical protein